MSLFFSAFNNAGRISDVANCGATVHGVWNGWPSVVQSDASDDGSEVSYIRSNCGSFRQSLSGKGTGTGTVMQNLSHCTKAGIEPGMGPDQ